MDAVYLKASVHLEDHWIVKEQYKYVYHIHLFYETDDEEKLFEFWNGSKEKLNEEQFEDILRNVMDELEGKTSGYLCRFKSAEIIGFFENDVNYKSEFIQSSKKNRGV